MLGTQLYLSDGPTLRREVTPIRNYPELPILMKPKPGTGLWTSTWREETQDSEWIEWCVGEHFGEPYEKQWWLLTPPSNVRLFGIDSLRDLEAWLQLYPLESPTMTLLMKRRQLSDLSLARLGLTIDYEAMSTVYDGVHLTSEGNAQTHLSLPYDLNSWDCESTLWFRWCFTSVEQIAVPEMILSEEE